MARLRLTPETAIKRQIKSYMNYMGWWGFPVLQGMGSFKGIPDLIYLKGGVILFIEVKAPGGKGQSEYQKAFEQNVKDHGGHYVLAYGYEDISKYIAERGLP